MIITLSEIIDMFNEALRGSFITLIVNDDGSEQNRMIDSQCHQRLAELASEAKAIMTELEEDAEGENLP